jgi:hypothetical protein
MVNGSKPYDDNMALSPVTSLEDFAERMKGAMPPTNDDVTILLDGRRLDSREAVMKWVAEMNAIRRQECQ